MLANCSPYFTFLQDINNLETQSSYELTVQESQFFLKQPIKPFSNYLLICLSGPKCLQNR